MFVLIAPNKPWVLGKVKRGCCHHPRDLLWISDGVLAHLTLLVLGLPLTRLTQPRANVVVVPAPNVVRSTIPQDALILLTDNPLEPIVRLHGEREGCCHHPVLPYSSTGTGSILVKTIECASPSTGLAKFLGTITQPRWVGLLSGQPHDSGFLTRTATCVSGLYVGCCMGERERGAVTTPVLSMLTW